MPPSGPLGLATRPGTSPGLCGFFTTPCLTLQLTGFLFGAIIYTSSKESDVKITIKIPKKHREHFVLFAQNTPFKQKVVESKLKFKRQPKHRNKEQ